MAKDAGSGTQDVQPEKDENAQGGGEQPAEKTFSQQELDRIVSDRLKREREKYADYADLKKQAGKWAEHEEAQKTEIEKAQERAQQAEMARDEALAKANERLMRAAFMSAAAAQNVAHPEDAYMLADLSEVEMTEDGAITGVDEAIKELLKAGRLVLRKQAAPNLDAGAGGGQSPAEHAAQVLTEAQLQVAHKMGVKPEDYAKGLRYKRQE